MGLCATNRAHSFLVLCALSFCTFLSPLVSGQTPQLNNVNLGRRQPPQPPPRDGGVPTNTSVVTPSGNSTSESQSPTIIPLALPSPSTTTPVAPPSLPSPPPTTPVVSSSSPLSSGVSSASSVQSTSAPITSTPTSTVVPTTPSAPSSTTSYLSLTLTGEPTPSTTYVVEVDSSSTSTSPPSPSSPPPADPSTSANSVSTPSTTTFWQNKGAVAATFLFSILLVAALVAVFVVNLLKKRNARRQALIDAEFMPHDQDSRSRASSLAPSVHDSPMDPFSRREVVYDNVPIDTTNSSRSPPARVVPTVQISPPSSYSESHRFVPPSQLLGTPEMSSVPRNRLEVRISTQSGYQPSFDSFYGAYSPTQ